MRCVMLMFDSLNRHYLPPYGADGIHAPNFARLAKRACTFDRSYVGSMPCMPARREMHTGRYNFLHNSWSPLEPFDDSLPELLTEAGVSSHIITDHYHYAEDNGAGYLTRYETWDLIRGQEGDPCIGLVDEPEVPSNINGKGRRQDWVNRPYFATDADHYQTKTIASGLEFIDRNSAADRWFLQIECFDPHEPFCCDERWKDLYDDEDYDGPLLDWPGYRQVEESPEQIQHARRNYKALLSKCDDSLGKVLDAFDQHDLWQDTMLIVWTDHGFLLGEHDWWAKNKPPLFEEVSHTPFFIHDPRHPDAAGQRRRSLVQPCVDLAPTLLRFFGGEPTEHMVAGRDLAPVITDDEPVREVALFGYFGAGINITDGRHVCYRDIQEPDAPLHRYFLAHITGRTHLASPDAMAQTELDDGFDFTKGIRILRQPAGMRGPTLDAYGDTWLYDIDEDPQQQQRLDDQATVERLLTAAARQMAVHEAPVDQYRRLGVPQPAA